MDADENTDLLRELADRAAVLETAAAYAAALDLRDWAGLAGVFTDDVCWEYPERALTLTGPAAIVAKMRESLRPLDATQHLNSNHRVTVRGDTAEHHCYFQAQHVRHAAPGGATFLGAGRYDDLLRRTPDGWRITRRTLTSVWSSGNPRVLEA